MLDGPYLHSPIRTAARNPEKKDLPRSIERGPKGGNEVGGRLGSNACVALRKRRVVPTRKRGKITPFPRQRVGLPAPPTTGLFLCAAAVRCLSPRPQSTNVSMTAILGISAFYHDSAAALVIDGQVVAAAQEERFTR
ncbi:MAG: carbamoyltransferase N-terminal domain-containing protein, partial [Pirellulales bacterium]